MMNGVIVMEIFVDTANIEKIREAFQIGILDGVTTNPTLIVAGGAEFPRVIQDIARLIQAKPVFVQVTGTTCAEMVKQGLAYVKLASKVIVKVPVIPEGIKAIHALCGEGIVTCGTLVFTPLQALLAAKAGASYVSPYVERVDRIEGDGCKVIEDIRLIFTNYAFKTKLLAAALKSRMQVLGVVKAGADAITVDPAVLALMLEHPLIDRGLDAFLNDWRRVKVTC
jgi:transaldolase